jgi:hypothetical protein
MNTTLYLITPKSYLAQMFHAEDRTRLANPVLVEMLYSTVADRFIWVQEPGRSGVYPVKAENLRWEWQLTNRQWQAATGRKISSRWA